ncbi:unnamed protein product, partial [Laminaria digitata]
VPAYHIIRRSATWRWRRCKGLANAWPIAVGKTLLRRRRLLLPVVKARPTRFWRQTTPVYSHCYHTHFITPPRVYHSGDTLYQILKNHPLCHRDTLYFVYQTPRV